MQLSVEGDCPGGSVAGGKELHRNMENYMCKWERVESSEEANNDLHTHNHFNCLPFICQLLALSYQLLYFAQ